MFCRFRSGGSAGDQVSLIAVVWRMHCNTQRICVAVWRQWISISWIVFVHIIPINVLHRRVELAVAIADMKTRANWDGIAFLYALIIAAQISSEFATPMT